MAEANEIRAEVPVGLEWEYSALRAEILQRIEMRQQIVAVTLTIAGVFLGVGLSTEGIALVYPLLAMFLAYAWEQNDRGAWRIATYLRDHVEVYAEGLRWETYREELRNIPKTGRYRITTVAHGGVFLVTQLLAWAIGLAQLWATYLDDDLVVPLLIVQAVLAVCDVWAMIMVVRVMRRARREPVPRPGDSA